MRTATIRVLHAPGTEPPPAELSSQGARVTLEGIYARAGIALHVERGPLHVGDRSPDAPFDLASLHALAERNRVATEHGWRATAMVVGTIEYLENFRPVRPLGVMFDLGDADTNGAGREGCAVAWTRMRSSPEHYLRTLAHELGHVFNLLHPESDAPPREPDTCIMSQTRALQSLGPYPANIRFAFADADAQWLREGPEEYVRPGGRPFGARPGTVDGLGLALASPLSYRVEVSPAVALPGEPITLRHVVQNDGEHAVRLLGPVATTTGGARIRVRGPAGEWRWFTPAYGVCLDGEATVLEPGERAESEEHLHFGASGPSFPTDGEYTVESTLFLPGRPERPLADTQVSVRAPDGAAERALVELLLRGDVGRLVALGGAPVGPPTASVLREALATHRGHPSLAGLRLAFAESLFRSDTTRDEGAELLRTVSPAELTPGWAARRELLRAFATARDGNAADESLRAFSDLAGGLGPDADAIVRSVEAGISARRSFVRKDDD